MGQSDIQAIIHGVIMNFLIKNIDESRFFTVGNETGLHLDKKSNVFSDIVISDKSTLQKYQAQGEYFKIPPLSVIEIDIQGDTSDFGISELDYYCMKTKALLDFGVKKVLWFFSKTKQVFVAKPSQNWQIIDWNKDLLILENYRFNINEELEKSGWRV
ncbi:Uma2 family endonuclease [Thermoflexibacter ruber]|uniref:Putative restriction endonuclease n=1 Tax=Thermoflexibacter ruber TaxID=1003 RepID=A0A1I2F2Y3_9BACT|nr:Uma2 family endonuclease [Thermoflexibacter ruber]SFE99732.1 Putative restriction endonuclease [Thermoflexibacter ruber]